MVEKSPVFKPEERHFLIEQAFHEINYTGPYDLKLKSSLSTVAIHAPKN